MSLRIVAPGLRTTIQDRGRPGLAALGVSPSGAADLAAARLANRLLGNPDDAAVVETTMGGLVLEALSPHWCVVTGAVAQVTVADAAVDHAVPFYAEPGSRIAIPPPRRGLRTYLAVNGGLATPLLLGSRSEDTLGRLIPCPVVADTRLDVGPPNRLLPSVDVAPAPDLPDPAGCYLGITPGPRRDWITDAAWSAFLTRPFTVTPQLDRVGVRIAGPRLGRAITDELPSEGLLRGSIQLPPSGDPIIFLADHPTTGGYPVIAVVDDAAMPMVAQLVPGQQVRFLVGSPGLR